MGRVVSRCLPAITLCVSYLFAAVSIAIAYDPPVDESGPLRVEIVGPAELTKVGEPVTIKVILENGGDKPLEAQLRVGVIDDWKVDPSDPIEVTVPAKRNAERFYRVTPAAGSYAAHYPIHALATFTFEGRKQTVHPILIVETKFVHAGRQISPVPWEPVRMRENSALALWQIPARRTVVQIFEEAPFRLPVGQSGSEPRSRADVAVTAQTLAGEARSVVAMHPPWADGNAGTIAVEYPLLLPADQSVKLQFANAMSPGGQSDGVTFRVRVAPWDRDQELFGAIVYERHTGEYSWQEATVDLSTFAGKKIRLQLESHPGPKNNTGWDRSYWAEPTLVVGQPPVARPFPPTSREAVESLGIVRCGGEAYSVEFYAGSRGVLDSVIGFASGDQTIYLKGFEVAVLKSRLDRTDCPLQLTGVQREEIAGGVRYRHSFDAPRVGSFDLLGSVRVVEGSVQVAFVIENAPAATPWSVVRLEDVAVGQWSRVVHRLYAGAGNVLVEPGPYQLRFDGHRLSTSVVGYDFEDSFSMIESTDTPPILLDVRPDRQHASLHASDRQVRTLIPAPNVWAGVKRWRSVAARKAAAGVERVAGRFVFDLWGGHYGASSDELRRAFRYGLTDSMVVWHNWQRWGYDYRLPEIYPPNAKYGTENELREMIDQCRQAGVLFALHDNYIDYYPDADGFSFEKMIAFHENGAPVRAWLNEGRGARSYRYRSDAVSPILKKNLLQIKEQLAPTAYFIDVWSSARPYDYWTADGEYFSSVYSRDTWGGLFAWIRDQLGDDAPQISESGHDQLIGWLDGAQTNHLRVGKPRPGRYSWSVWNWECQDAERVAWFDAAHHDRFILHGAGYESRYVAGLNPKLHGMYSDDYIVTEMMTGHPAMVKSPFGRDVVRKYWLTQDVARALALQTIDKVVFDGDCIHRQQVHWSDGGRVWVNRSEDDWEVAGVTLPPYGLLARVAGGDGSITAAIERRDGVITERCESPAACYFNARSPQGRALPIELDVQDFSCSGNRQIKFDLHWKLGVPVPKGWVPFLHFCDSEGEIVFQASLRNRGDLPLGEGRAVTNAVGDIPEKCRGGESYELCVGVYHPETGTRLLLVGPADGERRVRLGSILLRGDGDRFEGVLWTPFDKTKDPTLKRWNVERKVVDFGMVATNSAVRLTRTKDRLLVTPLPALVPARFEVVIRWNELPWELARPTTLEAVDERGKVLSTTAVELCDGAVTLTFDGKAFAYSLGP